MNRISIASFILLLLTVTSCEVIGDIFSAGVYTGIFIVVLIIAVIIFIVVKLGKRG
jgi:hypothetical protein